MQLPQKKEDANESNTQQEQREKASANSIEDRNESKGAMKRSQS
jgi:hypothetical protein